MRNITIRIPHFVIVLIRFWKEGHKGAELLSKDIFWIAHKKIKKIKKFWTKTPPKMLEIVQYSCQAFCGAVSLIPWNWRSRGAPLTPSYGCLWRTQGCVPYVVSCPRSRGRPKWWGIYRSHWSLARPQAIAQLTSRNRRLRANEFMTCPQPLSPFWNQDPAYTHLAKERLGAVVVEGLGGLKNKNKWSHYYSSLCCPPLADWYPLFILTESALTVRRWMTNGSRLKFSFALLLYLE